MRFPFASSTYFRRIQVSVRFAISSSIPFARRLTIYSEFQPGQSQAAEYVDEKPPVVEDQLSIAGVRLATMLNRMFPGNTPVVDLPVQPVEEVVTVYVTPSGSKYHAAGCRYLKGRHSPVALAEVGAAKGPCSVCNPPQR